MILIIGGAYQGKRAFAMNTFKMGEHQMTDGDGCDFSEIFEKPVLFNLHLLIGRLLNADIEPQTHLLPHLLGKNEMIIICNEIGLGIVPISEKERRIREEVGRILCILAEKADAVYRLYCGIPTLLKEPRPE